MPLSDAEARRYLCSDGKTQLCEDCECPRCGLTDWKSHPELCDIRCGGCGFWMINDMMEKLDVNEAKTDAAE